MKGPNPKATWNKTAERYNASVLVMFGIPTLIGGVIASVMVLVAGYQAGLLGSPTYWPAIVLAVPWIPIGLVAVLWGWFADPLGDRQG